MPFTAALALGLLGAITVAVVGYFNDLPAHPAGPVASVRLAEGSTVASGFPVPDTELAAVHSALHHVGFACGAGLGDRSGVIAADLDVMLEFALHHPEGRFVIDDEGGSTDALLLVLRQELQTCAPSSVARIEALLPDRYHRQLDSRV